MRRMAIVILAAGLAVPAVARAAGGPVAPVEGGSGVGVPGGSVRYLTVNVPGRTILERLDKHGVESWQNLRGLFGVPAAALDRSTTGLSADGRTLVLAGFPQRYPPLRTRLLVLRLERFGAHVQDRLSIPGYFTVDAISPDGRRLYLIHYTHPRQDVLRYEVRAYDLRARRLLAKPIVDPREPDEKMQGQPQARVMSADGRWAYTLYSRAQGAPFVHALDTRAGTAACIDLDGLTNPADGALRLLPPRGNGPLVVAYSGGPVKLIDRRTFAVSDPPTPTKPRKPAARHAAASPDRGGGLPWAAGAALLAAIALLGVTTRAARARSAA
jgi:hypothetical protein